MRRLVKRLGALSVALLSAAGSCGGGDSTPPIVIARVEISAPTSSLIVGSTVQLSATAKTGDGQTVSGAAITWTSDNSAVATVSSAGLVTGVAPGSAPIRATSAGGSGSVTVTVLPVPVASVVIQPDTATIVEGGTSTLTAVARDANGGALPGRVFSYATSDSSVATVSATGVVTALTAGTATITATSEGQKGTARITVVRPPLPKLALQKLPTAADPRFISAPPGDSRVYVATADGRVWIVQNDVLLPTPVLDIRSKVQQGGNGMSAIAFHPRFATNHYLYVDYVDVNKNNTIERYSLSSDGTTADAGSAQPVIVIEHPTPFDHYGGWMAFGPDGKLFVSTGDGGPGNSENAQNKSSLLGKLLRLDVDAALPYGIPADNPFVGVSGVRPEIWAFGLRNPFRDSFDRTTGQLFVADVGQDDWEEVSVVPSTLAGADYGWNKLEGSHCSPVSTTGCSDPGSILPVLEYTHPGRPGEATSTHPTGCSVTGGYAYRGSKMPSLRGHYFYGDFCAGWIRSFRLDKGVAVDQTQWFDKVGSIIAFGEDNSGEIYVITLEGSFYRIVQAP